MRRTDDLFIDLFLKNELRVVNKHLPYKRVPLKKLLSMEHPYIVLRDGSIHLIKRSELEYLASITPPDKHGELLIPIIIEARISLGEHAYVVRDPIAAMVLSKILGRSCVEGELVIYGREVAIIRRVLRTTTTIAFLP